MKKYLVIGNPIEHSLSPKLHNYWIKNNDIGAIYEKKKLLEIFKEEIYPLLTPSAIDPSHPFPFIINQGRALVMKLKKKKKKRILNSIIVIQTNIRLIYLILL